MDPFSLTVGAVGLLTTVTAFLVKADAFRRNFSEARSEINRISGNLTELSLLLGRLAEAREINALPNHLSRDLSAILENCKRTIIEVETHLENSSNRTLRGAAWAYSGKKRCIESCQRIESHKQTLNVALTLATA